jgi:hypothetical protein
MGPRSGLQVVKKSILPLSGIEPRIAASRVRSVGFRIVIALF